MNVEAFSTGPGMKEAEKFLWAYKCLMAVDESTSIKTPRAQRTINISSVGRHANYKRIMTGSPVTKKPTRLVLSVWVLRLRFIGARFFLLV